MTSRERVLATINHKEPDRVPIDLGATPSSGISAIAHANLMQYLGWAGDANGMTGVANGITESANGTANAVARGATNDGKTLIYDVVQQLAQPSDRLIERFNIDVIDIGRTFNIYPHEWYPITLQNGLPAYYPTWFKPVLQKNGAWANYHTDGTPIAKMPQGATFFDQTYFPWVDGYPQGRQAMDEALDEAMGKVLWAAMTHSPWDHATEPGFWDTLRSRTKKLRTNTDKALLINCGCNLFEWGTFLRRMDNFLMDLYIDKANVAILVELLMNRHMKTLERVCESVGDLVDIIRFGDDLGMDTGPFMGLDVYTELFSAHRKRLCDYTHTHSTMKTFLHSCGSVQQYIPSFIDEGVDVLNPLQTNCLHMDPAKIKADFGTDITFWGGGMDPREILNNGSPAAVRNEVFRRLEILAPRGGYVFNNIHNIMPDVPPENVVAFFDAVREFGDS